MQDTPLAAVEGDWKTTSPLNRGLCVDDGGAGRRVGGRRPPLKSFFGSADDGIVVMARIRVSSGGAGGNGAGAACDRLGSVIPGSLARDARARFRAGTSSVSCS